VLNKVEVWRVGRPIDYYYARKKCGYKGAGGFRNVGRSVVLLDLQTRILGLELVKKREDVFLVGGRSDLTLAFFPD
jgi:hypothetical protein